MSAETRLIAVTHVHSPLIGLIELSVIVLVAVMLFGRVRAAARKQIATNEVSDPSPPVEHEKGVAPAPLRAAAPLRAVEPPPSLQRKRPSSLRARARDTIAARGSSRHAQPIGAAACVVPPRPLLAVIEPLAPQPISAPTLPSQPLAPRHPLSRRNA